MRLEIYLSSIALALVMLTLLAWKWRIDLKISIFGSIPIGALAAFLVDRINSASGGLGFFWLLIIEASFVFTITFIIVFLRFYRDPDRKPAESENVLISPADGKVVYVNNVDKDSSLVSTKGNHKYPLYEILSSDLLAEPAYLLGIDMNILNVHVNRSPVQGKIIFRKRINGKFLSLRKEDSEILNQRVTTIIGNGKFNIGIIQIASRLVRSIISFGNVGENMELGQRIGMIAFGSQVDVAIPRLNNLKIVVKPGDKVKAGVSVIARYEIEGER